MKSDSKRNHIIGRNKKKSNKKARSSKIIGKRQRASMRRQQIVYIKGKIYILNNQNIRANLTRKP